uniref:Urokinase plasminogen activator surface receptor-like n=1 Tax=Sinocyclocheilus grahami TaxID=75366 RepID=A0A672KAJ3_SINGR
MLLSANTDRVSLSLSLSLCNLTKGHSLSCYECRFNLTGSCANQNEKTCPSGFSKLKAKDCAVDCVSGSMNLGTAKTSLACCNTDRCNVQDAPDPSTSAPNGKTCYSCDEKSCSNILSCSGSEDRCFKATGENLEKKKIVKGCLSKSICDAETSVRDVQSASCCEGNLCNSAESVTQSFLFL